MTPEVTETACLLARRAAAELYLREVERLHDELSIRPCSDELSARVQGAAEPYRAWLAGVRARLLATLTWCERGLSGSGTEVADRRRSTAAEPYIDAGELWADLRLCHDSLVSRHLEVIAHRRLLDVLRRVAAFGTTLFPLDIRQEAAVHGAAVDTLTRHLGLGRYAHWDEEQRQGFLRRELAGGRTVSLQELPGDPRLREVMETLAVCRRQGLGSLGAYVVSMASRPSDVLSVMWLQKIAGLPAPLRVVPLFETLDALDGAPAVVERLLDLPEYRRAVGREIEIMVGYSDSAKDVGRLGAAWALYRMQEAVTASCKERGVDITLFHGRGGTIARGGGPIYLAILSQPPGSVDGRLRVTIQGETIDASFGVPRTAVHSLCRYPLAALETSLCPPASPRSEWRALMDRLAEVGAEEYRRVVRDTASFGDYFRAVTPINELGRLNIGSRPGRRRPDGTFQSLRAIPWIFSWTQTRLLLPSWLGVGEALRRVSEEGKRRTLRAMVRRWPFFRSLLDLIEMVLAKADPDVAAAYEAALAPGAFGTLGAELRERCRETNRQVLALKGQTELLEGDAFLRRSIALRNPYVDPLNLLQVELLRRIRAREDPQVADALLATVKGIAAGMRNTG